MFKRASWFYVMLAEAYVCLLNLRVKLSHSGNEFQL